MKTLLGFPPAALSRGRFFPETSAASSAFVLMLIWPSLGGVLALLGVQFVDDKDAALASFFRRFLGLEGVLGVLGVQFVDDTAALASLFRRFLPTFRRSFTAEAARGCVPSPFIFPSQQHTGQRMLGSVRQACAHGTTSMCRIEVPSPSLQKAFSSHITPSLPHHP